MHLMTRLFNFLQKKDFLLLVHRPPMDSREATAWYPSWVYETMETDEVRNRQYRAVIAKAVEGKTVLELGTGRKALWARFCREKGAKRVYAIEANPKSFASSKEYVEKSGLSEIHLVPGFSDQVSIAEPCDVLVHDLIGAIGSCEGMVSFLEDAKARFLSKDPIHIPKRCTTFFFPSMVPPQTTFERVFGWLARGGTPISKMPVVLLFGYRREAMLAQPQVFEDLEFEKRMELEGKRRTEFRVEKDGGWDALAFYIRLHVDDSHVVDSLMSRTNWYIPYIRPFRTPVPVRVGDSLIVESAYSLFDGRPNYSLRCFHARGNSVTEVGEHSWSGV